MENFPLHLLRAYTVQSCQFPYDLIFKHQVMEYSSRCVFFLPLVCLSRDIKVYFISTNGTLSVEAFHFGYFFLGWMKKISRITHSVSRSYPQVLESLECIWLNFFNKLQYYAQRKDIVPLKKTQLTTVSIFFNFKGTEKFTQVK